MEYELEDGIAIPPVSSSGRKQVYPFDRMEVGQSFFVPHKTTSKFSSTIKAASRRTGFKSTSRTDTGYALDEDGNRIEAEGVRIWRVAVDPSYDDALDEPLETAAASG
jgi:hypothetical protein